MCHTKSEMFINLCLSVYMPRPPSPPSCSPPLAPPIRAQEHELSKRRSQFIKAKVSSSHHRKKVEEYQQDLRRGRKLLAVTESELEEERQEVAQLERAWKRYEEEVQEKSATEGRDIELERDQVSPKGLDQGRLSEHSGFVSKKLS